MLSTEQIQLLSDYTAEAHGIAFDGCHKIYVALDKTQFEFFRDLDYEFVKDKESLTPEQMSEKVQDWFHNSCSLRFITAVETMPNEDCEFTSIVDQFEVDYE